MKLFGHPFHLLLIHFPVALLPMDAVLSAIGYNTGKLSYLTAAYYCLAGGVATGLFAIVTGIADLIAIPKKAELALGTALMHGFINTFVLLIYGVLAYKAWAVYPAISKPSFVLLVLKAGLVLVLFIGNYLGGKLVIDYHIGIKKEIL